MHKKNTCVICKRKFRPPIRRPKAASCSKKCSRKLDYLRHKDAYLKRAQKVVRKRPRAYKIWHRKYYKTNKKRIQAYGRSYYRKNKAIVIARTKEHSRTIQFEAFRHYGRRRKIACVCCGESNPLVLTLDHKKGGGCAHRRRISGNRKYPCGKQFYLWLKQRHWPRGFQTMCYNCNCGRWRNGGICPLHGK